MIAKTVVNDFTVAINPGRVLDNSNAGEMAQLLSDLQSAGYRNIIVEMAQLEFLSSAGVGSILGALEDSRTGGGDIFLCDLSPKILHVLKVLDLQDYLTIKEDKAQAVEVCVQS